MKETSRANWQRAARIGFWLNLTSFVINSVVFWTYEIPTNLWMALINAMFVAFTMSQIDSHPYEPRERGR